MQRGADFIHVMDGENATIRFSGRMTLARMGDLPERLGNLAMPVDRIDVSEVERVDTVGAWLIHRLKRDYGAKVSGANKEVETLLTEIGKIDKPVKMRPEQRSVLVEALDDVGKSVKVAGTSLLGTIGFFGAVMVSLGNLIRHPRSLRINAVVQRFEVVGVNALGIIGLMSFLIGIVIAQQGAVQLAQFGADIYTINLVGRSAMRELGVLMTAIMVAGRSGSAFAAQLGTMKLTEEVDAMRTIGVSPVDALVLPRIFAAVLMMPLLSFYAGICAIIGGMLFVWIGLDIPPITYFQRIREVVPMTDVWIGLIKAPVFGAIIGLTGCYQGLQVEANAEEVGLRTTAAVVQAIFMVIVLDAFFAVFFSSIGWR